MLKRLDCTTAVFMNQLQADKGRQVAPVVRGRILSLARDLLIQLSKDRLVENRVVTLEKSINFHFYNTQEPFYNRSERRIVSLPDDRGTLTSAAGSKLFEA